MERATTERRLYSAALDGDVYALRELLQQDELLLDRITPLTTFNETPLHVAATRGHLDFVREVLKHSPHLVEEVDSRKLSALHVAAAKGFVEIVEGLLDVCPRMCFERDGEGRNPVHLAAVKGRVEVLRTLTRRRREAVSEKMRGGETVLHLCVKYDQLEALEMLVEEGCVDQLVNVKDEDGNSILHRAVWDKQIETVKFLVNTNKIELNEKNKRGETALDILSQTHRDVIDMEINDILREAGGLRATELPNNGHNYASFFSNSSPRPRAFPIKNHAPGDWLARKRDSIMVVASLIATMAFQAGVNPPSGVWQEDLTSPRSSSQYEHKAGESMMAYQNPKSYRYFFRANTVAFVSSLSTILLLISGLPFRRKLFMWILMVIMWLTITSIALTYGIAIVVVTPQSQKDQLGDVIELAVMVWCGVMALLLLGNTIRLASRWLRKTKGIDIWPWRRFHKSTVDVLGHGHGNGNCGQEALQIQLA